MTTAIELRNGDLNAALQVVKSTDLGTLTLRREQLKQQIKDLKPQLQYHYPKRERQTEVQRQAAIQYAQQQIQQLETRLHVRAQLYEKVDTFLVTLTNDERSIFESMTRYHSRDQEASYDRRRAEEYREQLARLGEPEPEWVDPRVETAEKLAVLEAALNQVNKSIREASK